MSLTPANGRNYRGPERRIKLDARPWTERRRGFDRRQRVACQQT